jgi:hypothetical protein
VARQQAHTSEIQDLKLQIELKGNEIRSLVSANDGLKGVNEELKVRIRPSSNRSGVDYRPSEPLLSRQQGSKAGRIWRKVPKTWSGRVKPLPFNWPSLTG